MNVKRKTLLQQFETEYSKSSHYLKVSKCIALSRFKKIIKYITTLNYTEIAVEITYDGLFLFNIYFDNNYRALVSPTEFFSLWKNKVIIMAKYVKIKESVRFIKREIVK